jgi:hypothetical protein
VSIPIPAPIPVSPWPAILSAAQRAAESGRFDEAERMLLDFSVHQAGTSEGAESDFWRALFKMDPANHGASPHESLPLLDAYLSGGASFPRYAEAQILRRLVETVDSTSSLVATLQAAADARQKTRDDEVKQLTEDLNKTMAELERIKRRLLPKPPGTTPP